MMMRQCVVWSGTVASVEELGKVVDKYGERNTVYVDIEDQGLCFIDWMQEVIEISTGYCDAEVPITDLEDDAFPTLVVVTGPVFE